MKLKRGVERVGAAASSTWKSFLSKIKTGLYSLPAKSEDKKNIIISVKNKQNSGQKQTIISTDAFCSSNREKGLYQKSLHAVMHTKGHY